MRKKIILIPTALLFLGLVAGTFYLNSLIPIITGYPAKYLCSAVFISNQQASEVEALDLNFSLVAFTRNEVNYQEKSVTSSFLWGKSKAVYREGFGAVLVRDNTESILKSMTYPSGRASKTNPDTIPWPMGNMLPVSNHQSNSDGLGKICSNVIQNDSYGGHAFAFLVLHKEIPVAEGYKEGFSDKTRFLSWSMAKSFTNAIVGIMVKDGLLHPEETTGFPEWQSDERKKITLNHLLRMQSGLEWNEDYGNRSDVTLMLYTQGDFSGFAMKKKLAHSPGAFWYYSSGTTNIVNLLMRRKFRNDSAYYRYVPQRLFDKTGMTKAIFESDATGTFVGSSYIYATARDYARFGLLYLHDGIFNGERILPEGWVNYTVTPAAGSKGNYGAFFWLNRGKMYPDAPADMYFCNGHDGQRIFIIPSRDVVVVILGYSPNPGNVMDFNRLLRDILNSPEL